VDEDVVGFFLPLNNTGGPVDVWAVVGVSEDDLVESPEGSSTSRTGSRPNS
jgi:hypothetical protein